MLTKPHSTRRNGRRAALALVLAAATLAAAPARAAETKPYDEQILRLAELLGAIHYLRELCSASDGQIWRDRMKDLIESESSSALRRARLTRSFNQGYRGFSRTYVTCTTTAQSAIGRFLAEGVEISESLAKRAP